MATQSLATHTRRLTRAHFSALREPPPWRVRGAVRISMDTFSRCVRSCSALYCAIVAFMTSRRKEQ